MNARPWESATIAPNGRAVKDNFTDWFGLSQTLGVDGPLVYHHGGSALRDAFEPRESTRYTMGRSYSVETSASFFAEDRTFAATFGAQVTSVYLRICKPLNLREGAWGVEDPAVFEILKAHFGDQVGFVPPNELWDILDQPDAVRSLRAMGYDGVFLMERDRDGHARDTCATFDPTQVKSATHNLGLYALNDPSLTDAATLKAILAKEAITQAQLRQGSRMQP